MFTVQRVFALLALAGLGWGVACSNSSPAIDFTGDAGGAGSSSGGGDEAGSSSGSVTGGSGGSSGAGGSSSSGSSSGAGSSSGGGGACAGLAPPTTTAACTSCGSSGQTCQANGCYGGWYCNTSTNVCESAPTDCSGSSSGSGGSSGGSSSSSSGGGPITGSVGATGGSISQLVFAIVGDTRPPNPGDTSGYPTAIATKIFQDLDGLSPRPPFGVSTGDYMYNTPGQGQAAAQLDLYVQARGYYSNVMFPAMGNHECNGYTDSNCGPGTSTGTTENYTAFMGQLLKPLGQTANPYYSIDVNDTAGQWTAKFIFVAANAWTSAEETWLDTTMSKATTYTFLIRHEPASDGGSSGAPGVDPAESVMAKYPYTLSIVGHSHLVEKSGTREVIFGNGGAPLSGGSYGFGLITQLSNGNIQVDSYDYQTLQPNTGFRFAVTPTGAAAP